MTTTTNHPVSPEELMALLDGQLSADRAQFIAAHLADCSECNEAFAGLQGSSLSLHQWKVDKPKASLDDRILRAAAEQTPTAANASLIHKFQLFFSRPLPWTVACLVVVGLTFLQFLGRPSAMKRYSSRRSESSSVLYSTPVVDAPLDSPQAASGGGGSSAYSDATAWGLAANNGEKMAATHRAEISKIGSDLQVRAGKEPALPAAQVQPMIARTAELRVVVPEFVEARTKLDGILIRYRAYAASLQVNSAEGSPRGLTGSLRIPASQLGTVLAELKSLGRVETESQSGEEVTEQHADLIARLKNSRETEQRLQDILRTRTGKVTEILEVEQEISRVRGEIEQMEAERKTLEHRVDFATLNLTLAEEFKAQLSSPAPSLGTQWRNSLVTGSRNAFDSLFALLLFLSEVAPVLLLWLALLFPIAWLLWRRFRPVRAALS